jgi:hypothetical protein
MSRIRLGHISRKDFIDGVGYPAVVHKWEKEKHEELKHKTCLAEPSSRNRVGAEISPPGTVRGSK